MKNYIVKRGRPKGAKATKRLAVRLTPDQLAKLEACPGRSLSAKLVWCLASVLTACATTHFTTDPGAQPADTAGLYAASALLNAAAGCELTTVAPGIGTEYNATWTTNPTCLQDLGTTAWGDDYASMDGSSHICLVTRDSVPVVNVDDFVASVDLHEMGHAMGLGHSSNPADIMTAVVGADLAVTPDKLERYLAQLKKVGVSCDAQ